MKKQQKCYIYTRVSTSMQVDGYSLDAQKDKLRKYAEYQEMSIVGEYSDEGKSGKSVEGRPQFKQMLADVESGKDNVDYVLVFKLSRFGRNAADVLSSLQKMQDYGVNLICVEDGIDSSKDVGKLMISVLSAVAEIERENILVQTMEGFSTSFVKGVLDNPIYCGKLAFGRRKNEKIPGTRNEYHIVKQKDYLLSDGVHEAIISEEMWNQAHRKRQETGVLQVKTHSLEHEHILSGIIKCPVCGSGMYGNVNRKKHPDGGYYKDYFYYACKHRKLVDGHRCTYKRQWNEDRINAAVEEIIRKFVKNPKFEQEIRKQIGSSIDTSELDKEYDGLKDRLSQTTGAKNRLADQMDHLSVSDKNYDKKYNDMQERLDKLYDEITDIEDAMEEVETRLYNIRQDKISEDNVYQFLLFFDKLYDKFTDLEKKTFLKSFLSDVFIYEEEQKDGRILKGLRFKFPIYMNGRNVLGVDWDNESTDETVVLLSYKKPDGHINVKVEFGEGEGKVPLDNIAKRAEEYKPKERVTYKMIKEYIEAKYGFKVHTAYIAEVKRDLGLPMYDAPNAVEELKQPRKHPTAEKVEAIKDALRYFEIMEEI
ncbi:recombinase family protein [Agathobacter rectalis]|uniref:Recombinase family protein n=2 Tax=Agathobacter rectalis TaxID=39491 RepID=A0A414A411_9FIRM|nr:recombinase family protein [Agathobacter rectalis]RHC40248.1 recombinase family protein [Agathobacter rectalis]